MSGTPRLLGQSMPSALALLRKRLSAQPSGSGITRNRPLWWLSKASATARLLASDSAALRCSAGSWGSQLQIVMIVVRDHFLLGRVGAVGAAAFLGQRDPPLQFVETLGQIG